jgi:HCOMODA/2-hydroxy-3-carboxy-muconic semialdehyde decarboxylase
MRGHGAVAVGNSIKQAVARAVYAEVNARLQSEALRLGEITFLNEREAASAAATIDTVLDRPWELWKSRVSGER